MGKYQEIMGEEHWPCNPGHGEEHKMWSGKRKAINSNGTYWLIKKDGLFKRWEWRPVKGMFVQLSEVQS